MLLREYGMHLRGTLGAENMCMAGYERELASLPLPYELLLLGFVDGKAAGCALVKPITRLPEKACELKRLWVRPEFRGLNLGRELTQRAMQEASERGYTAMYLDTVPAAMQTAHRLYLDLGFEPIERYNDNPVSDVTFFRRAL